MFLILSGIFFSSPYYLSKAAISLPDFVRFGESLRSETPP